SGGFMELSYFNRTAARKSEAKKIRREGGIPAIIYARQGVSENVLIDQGDFKGLLRQVQPGRLSTTIFSLKGENGGQRKAILKETQYAPTTYDVMHLDFEELFDTQKVNVKVPIECFGMADCPGIKLGGVLRLVIRAVPVSCFPPDIPTAFQLDVSGLGMRDSR